MVESRLAATLEALGEAVTIQSADGRSIYANQAALDLLKLSSLEELVATAPGEISARFEIQSEDGTPINVSEFPGNRALRGEEYPSLLVRNVVRATGEERWLLNKATVLKDSENRIEMVINLIENVTAPKQAERRAKFLAQAGKTLASSRRSPFPRSPTGARLTWWMRTGTASRSRLRTWIRPSSLSRESSGDTTRASSIPQRASALWCTQVRPRSTRRFPICPSLRLRSTRNTCASCARSDCIQW
jgi:PAS domain-containing protein